MRRLHSIAGLAGALIVVFMALTGAILSVQPAVETISAGGTGTNVAQLAAAVSSELPGVERITRSASGVVVAYYKAEGAFQAAQIDPASGHVTGPYEPSPFFTFISELHRSLFFGDAGRAVAGVASLVIATLAATGILLIVKRAGGWRKLFGRMRGTGMSRFHAQLGRLAVIGLVVTSLSGAWMSGVYFELVPDGSSLSFALPPTSTGDVAAGIDTLSALAATPLSDLRELLFPAAGDASDVFTITTAAGQGYVDQSTGAMLSFIPNTFWQQVYETIYLLHTGQGAWWLGLLLGAVALAVPAMAVTGVAIWLREQRNRARLPANATWLRARTVILVGSENGSTMGFAAALHRELLERGERVHTASMNTVRYYPQAERLIVLAATYGDGQPPASARAFLSRLRQLDRAPAPRFAVLGFGDRSFSDFCGYARQVEAALEQTGASPMLEFATVDKQSGRDFSAWGLALGDALGQPLQLAYTPPLPQTRGLTLVEREDFGIEVQAPTAILRFAAAAPRRSMFARLLGRGTALPHFEAGDLLGIIPPDSTVPRYYSLASSSRDGLIEICVRKQAGGVCSTFLHGLAPGAVVDGFIRANPVFRPARHRPMILIGAGAGVAPLAGFVSRNTPRRPAYLFFGARDPQSDFLYRDRLEAALDDGRLAGLSMAFSRVVGGGYVQDNIRTEAEMLRRLVTDGAQILVCGGLDMARGVRSALDGVLTPLGLSTDILKAQGRYLEDAY